MNMFFNKLIAFERGEGFGLEPGLRRSACHGSQGGLGQDGLRLKWGQGSTLVKENTEKRKVLRMEISSVEQISGPRENIFSRFRTPSRNSCENDTCAWTPNKVFLPAWVAKRSRLRIFWRFLGEASLGKWADTSKSWNTDLSAAGALLGKSRQV